MGAVENERLRDVKTTREGELESMFTNSHNSYNVPHSKFAQMLPPDERERLLGTTQQGLFDDSTLPITLNHETANPLKTIQPGLSIDSSLITLIKDDPSTMNATISFELARINTAQLKEQGGTSVYDQVCRFIHGPSYEFRTVHDGIMKRTPRGRLSEEDFNAVVAEAERQALGSTELCTKRKTGVKITCADGTPASSSNPYLNNYDAVWSHHLLGSVKDKSKADSTLDPVDRS